MRSALTAFFLLTAVFLHGQDLTGVWQGHFRSSNGIRSALIDDRYKFEVQIAQRDKHFAAITYSYQSSSFYGKALATGTVNPKTAKVILQETKLVEVRLGNMDEACTMICFLQYSRNGDEEFLEGTYGSMNLKDSGNCGRGTIFLRKVTQSDFYKEPFVEKREQEINSEKRTTAKAGKNPPPLGAPAHPPAKKNVPGGSNPGHNNHPDSLRRTAATPPAKTHPRVPPPARVDIAKIPERKMPSDTFKTPPLTIRAPEVTPEVLTQRSNELVQTITVNTNDVTLNIYDDGAIDHDTVTVFVDKKMVVAHEMLTDHAIVVSLHLDDTHPYHEVVMVADNEGEIPPNTSLMIVKAGGKEYEVRITSTEQKNAVVVFKYERAK